MADERESVDRYGIEGRIPDSGDATLVRFEEEAGAHIRGWRGVGFLRARKRVEAVRVDEQLVRASEELDAERVPVEDGDPGGIQTLPDGGVSIPIYEEELVVTKRVVLRERVVIRKRLVGVPTRVRDEVRREHVDLEVDDGLEDRVHMEDEGRPSA